MATMTKATLVASLIEGLKVAEEDDPSLLELGLFLGDIAWDSLDMDGVHNELSRLQDMEALVVGLTGALRRISKYYTKHPDAPTAWARDTAEKALDRFETACAGDWREELNVMVFGREEPLNLNAQAADTEVRGAQMVCLAGRSEKEGNPC